MPEKKKAARPARAAAKTPARRAAVSRKPAAEGEATEARASAPETTQPRPRRAREARKTGPMIVIEQYASGIQCPFRQKRTLRALGLRHPRHRVERPDNPAVRGMVKAIPHLVRIVEGTRGA